MRRHLRLALSLVAILATLATSRADGPIRHRLAFFEYGNCPNRFVELAADGTMIREFRPLSIAVIFQTLPNGNLVYAYGGKPTGVVEIDAHNKTAWNYVSHCPQVLGCERLANGNTLVAEQGPCQVVEVDHGGKVVHVTKLFTNQAAYHLQVRNIHRLENGDILAAHEGDGAIREYSPSGQIVWQYTGVENTGDARRLPNGNTLIGGGTQKRLIEVSPDGKIVWEFTAADAPQLNLVWVSSIQILKNGNYLVGNFLRNHEGHGRTPSRSRGTKRSSGPSPTTSDSSR